MVFVTLFSRLKNVHLLKDVGMIPFIMHRDFGADSRVVSFQNEDSYPYLLDEVKGLKLQFLDSKGRVRDSKESAGASFQKAKAGPGPIRKEGDAYAAEKKSSILGPFLYVWRNAGSIDVLNVYHLNLSSFLCLLAYRIRKRKGGIGYLKLDMDLKGYKRLFMMNPVGAVKRMTMKLADVISVETTLLAEKLRKRYGPKVIYIPNGFYASENGEAKEFHKENLILTVGSLGTYPKATDTLLKAFEGAADGNDWKLVLVGPVADSFRPFRQKFMKRHPDLRKRIIFTGEIRDKEKLTQLYRRAKIFVLPSRSESFGIVLLEAAANGDFLVTTTGVPAGRDIYNDGKFGFIVPPDDIPALSGAFVRLMNSKADWETRAREIADCTWHDFRWEPVVAKLNDALTTVSEKIQNGGN